MTNSVKAWNEFRGSLMGLVTALTNDVAEQAPKKADEFASRAPKMADHLTTQVTAAATPYVMKGLMTAVPFLVRRKTQPMLGGPLALLGAAAAGAVIMHFLDPERGAERRRVSQERIAALMRVGSTKAERVGRMASERTGDLWGLRSNGYGTREHEIAGTG